MARLIGGACIIVFLNIPGVFAGSPNTITIDGNNDFAADEVVAGTSGSAWYFTWDASNFYFGISAPDVAANSATKFVLLYIDSDPRQNPLSGNGSSTGETYNTQTPGLPFNADHHFRWRTDNNFTDLMSWNGSGWVSGNNSGVQALQSGAFVEYKIPRSNLGNPSQIYVCGAMINEQGGVESTFFLTPQSNAPEGYDIDFTHYFGFALVDNNSAGFAGNEDTYPIASVASGDYSAGATWTGGVAPHFNSNVLIQNGHTVSLEADGAAKHLTTIAGGTFNGDTNVLTLASNAILTNNGTFTAGAGTVSFSGSGEITGAIEFNVVDIAGGVDFGSGATINGILRINTGGYVNTNAPVYGNSSTLLYNTGGSYNVSADWTANASSGAGVPQNVQLSNGTTLNLLSDNRTARGTVTIDAGSNTLNSTSGILTIGGDFSNNGTFNHNSGNVTFTGSGSRSITGNATTNFNTVTVNLNDATSVLEALSPITMATDGLTLSQGILKISSASTITPFAGSTTIPATAGYHLNHAGAVSNWGGSGSLTVQGTLIIDDGEMTVGSSSGNELELSSSSSVATINGGTLKLAGRVRVSGSSAGNGLLINGGEVIVTTVGNGSSTIAGFNMNATGRFIMTGGSVTIEQANSSTGSGASDVFIGGVSGAGAKSISGGTFRFGNASTTAGSGMRLNSQLAFFNVTIDNEAGVTLQNNLTVNNTLTFLSGNINTTNLLSVTIPAGGAVVRTSGHVAGNLQKHFATGSNVMRTFEIGTGSDYAPVDITIASVFGAGTMTLRTVAGDHPNISSSDFNAAKSINRHWIISASGLSITTYDATFHFANNDIDAGVNANALNVGRFAGGSWTYLTTGVRTATSTQAVALGNFGQFQVAEFNTPDLIADAGVDKTICSGASTVIGGAPTASGGTSPYTYSWTPIDGLDDANLANPTASPTSTTTYTVTVTDDNNNTAMDEVVITVNESPVASAGADLATTSGVSAKIGANPTANGAGPFTYNWNPAAGLNSTTVANPIATPSSTTTYEVTVEDANGCIATDQVTVRAGNLVNSRIKAIIGPTNLYDPVLNQVRADIAVRNISSAPIYGPLTAVFRTLTPGPPTITIPNADGGGEGLGCYYDYTMLLGPDEVLSPGETSGYKLWIFQEHVTPPVNFRFFADVIEDLDGIPKTAADDQPLALAFDLHNGAVQEHSAANLADNVAEIPNTYALHQNHPNPFNPSTTMQFDMPEAAHVTLKIYNSVGQLIKQVASGNYASGRHKVVWDATDDHGGQVSTGV
ncbi:hypothetical protein HUU40_12575, partial [candidate division KSB1 bacterium]|nr:hypothetical protein [candidate division KSB1 bacterium]